MGEEISKMTVEDVKEAVKEDEARKKNTLNMSVVSRNQNDNIATKFLKAASTSCRAFGTSKEVAEYARRKCFLCKITLGCTVYF